MTRARLNRRLRKITFGLVMVLAVGLAAKVAAVLGVPAVPQLGIGGAELTALAAGFYDFMKDMAVVFVTIAAAYLASMLQKRANFVESLEEEWRRIVKAKAALVTYCARETPSLDQYLDVCEELSRTIDTMRIAYKNVGETDKLIGLYPFAPLHNMRRAMTTIHPDAKPTPAERALVAELVQTSFAALRENFLEELDLEEPTTPVLRSASRRLKVTGRTPHAAAMAEAQGRRIAELKPPPSRALQELQDRLDHMREIEDGRLARGTPFPGDQVARV